MAWGTGMTYTLISSGIGSASFLEMAWVFFALTGVGVNLFALSDALRLMAALNRKGIRDSRFLLAIIQRRSAAVRATILTLFSVIGGLSMLVPARPPGAGATLGLVVAVVFLSIDFMLTAISLLDLNDRRKVVQLRYARAVASLERDLLVRRAVMEASFDAAVAINALGNVVEWSAAAERIFGFGRDYALGRRLSELIIPEHLRALHNAGVNRALKTGEMFLGQIYQTVALTSTGETMPVDVSVVRVPDELDAVFVGFIRPRDATASV